MNVNISNEFNNVSRKYQTSLSWVNQDLMLIFATCCGWLVARFRRGVCVCGWVGGWGGGSYGHHGWLPTYNHEMGHWLCLPEKSTQYYKHNLITFIVIILTVVPQNFIKYQFIDLSWYTKTSATPDTVLFWLLMPMQLVREYKRHNEDRLPSSPDIFMASLILFYYPSF